MASILGEDWVGGAACRGLEYTEPGLFFPEFVQGRVSPESQARIDLALRICDDCPVVWECGDYYERHAGDNPPPVGIWGGQVRFLRRRNLKSPTHPN